VDPRVSARVRFDSESHIVASVVIGNTRYPKKLSRSSDSCPVTVASKPLAHCVGADALECVRAGMKAFEKEIADWEAVCASTNFD
jgi:hypothetical protein